MDTVTDLEGLIGKTCEIDLNPEWRMTVSAYKRIPATKSVYLEFKERPGELFALARCSRITNHGQ